MTDHADLARKPAPQPQAAADAMQLGAAPAVAQLAETAQSLNAGPAVVAQRALAQTLSRPPARHVLPRAPVIQAKLYRGQDEIQAPERQADASPIVRSLIQSPTGYVLRATSRLTDPVVHALRRDQKYLLGERHDQSNWPERSAGWGVDTMIEAGKAIPEQPRAAPAHGVRADQPLESSHAYTVGVILQWRTGFAAWHKIWTEWKTARLEEAALMRELEDMDEDKSDSDEKKSGQDDDRRALLDPHDRDVELGHGQPGEDDADLDMHSTAKTKEKTKGWYDWLVRWANQLQTMITQQQQFIDSNAGVPDTKLYQGMARELPGISTELVATMKRIRLIQVLGNDRDAAREQLFDRGFDKINTAMGKAMFIFSAASTDVTSEQRAGLFSRAKGTVPLARGEGLDLANPAREAAMIRNINAARAPLLVKIGNKHVERVTAGVHGGVAVPIGKDFDQMTRQPGGERANPLGYAGMALGAGLLVGGAIAGATLLGGGLLLGGLLAAGLGFRNRNRPAPGELT